MHRQPLPLVLALVPALLAAALTGCRSNTNPDLAGPPYPGPEITRGQTLNIQVVRHDTKIRLTNTTARAFGESRLWLNRWNSQKIDALAVGQTLNLSLWDFRDEYGESFNAGGFWATRTPEEVVVAELQVESTLFPLIVIGEPED